MKKQVKRLTTALMTSVMLLGSFGSVNVYAAEPEELRQQAEEEFNNGNYVDAGNAYVELAETGFATDKDYWYGGIAQYAQGYYFNAAEWFEDSYNNLQEGSRPEAVYEYKVRNMYAAGKYRYAQLEYQYAKENGFVTPFMDMYYGDVLMSCKNPKEALKYYKSAYDGYEGQENYQAMNAGGMGNAYRDLKQYVEAENAYKESYQLSGDEEKYISSMMKLRIAQGVEIADVVNEFMSDKGNTEIAEKLTSIGFDKEAIPYYEKAMEEGNEELNYDLALAHYEVGNTKKAAELLEEIVAKEPNNTAAMNMLGAVYCDGLGRYAEAEELFHKVIVANPQANGTMANLGVIYLKTGDMEKASNQYLQTANNFPIVAGTFKSYIQYTKDITVDEAISVFSQFQGWPEDDKLQAVLLGEAISDESMTEKTMESFLGYYSSLLEKYPEDYYLLYYKGILLNGLGRHEEALKVCKQVYENAGVMSYYAKNGLGNTYYAMKDYTNAIQCYMENIENYNNADLWSAVIDCYLQMEDYDGAMNAIHEYEVAGGEKETIAAYRMRQSYLQEMYDLVLEYSKEVLEANPYNYSAMAYQAAALEKLEMDGADALIAELDSINYEVGSEDKLIIDSILGRLDMAKETYKAMLAQYPGKADSYKDYYELKNLIRDAEYCEMAGIEYVAEETNTGMESVAILESNIPILGIVILVSVVGVLTVLLAVKKGGKRS